MYRALSRCVHTCSIAQKQGYVHLSWKTKAKGLSTGFKIWETLFVHRQHSNVGMGWGVSVGWGKEKSGLTSFKKLGKGCSAWLNNFYKSWKSDWLITNMKPTSDNYYLMQHLKKLTTEGNELFRVEWTIKTTEWLVLLWGHDQSHWTDIYFSLLPILPLDWYNKGHGGKLTPSKIGPRKAEVRVFN